MMTRRFTVRGRARVATGAAAIGTLIAASLVSPVLAGESSAATRTVSPVSPSPEKPGGTLKAAGSKVFQPVGLPDGFRPEGVTSGPKRTFFAGSLADGQIWTGSLVTGDGRRLTAGVAGRSVRGLEWDKRSNLLWAAAQDGATGVVLAIDACSGKVRHRIEVPGAQFLNDLTIEPNAVWVTDSRVDRLTRIALNRDTGHYADWFNFIPLKGAWPTDGDGNRANGIDTLWDGALLLNHSTAGGLWRVDPHTGTATSIPVKGGPGITGGDGLERKGHTVYVVRGSGQNQVAVLKLHHNWRGWRASWRTALSSPDLDVPSTATIVNHTLWAVNARFGVEDPQNASYRIIPLRKKVNSGL
ncbi:hypothetical protein KIH74_12530 [Kineosporia sp. J2-2]|uniref:Sugar lactone lactonase YvrE n=1 Tax=Kineosporia corallincola TaxID=2835133 RepID=A0ABS5TF97_9ACTN|nr:hypothetical protein [Kineosporia corallincola]MBT0769756.1 hypothetical protein [Kineosporia corallincola]